MLTVRTTIKPVSVSEFCDLALDVATTLMASGAHCGRIMTNLGRLAWQWNFEIQANIVFTGITLTITNPYDKNDTVTRYKSTPPSNIQLELLTHFSRMTWLAKDGDLTFEQMKSETERIKNIPPYNKWVVSVAIGISCACLCLLFGGNLIDAGVALVASLIGAVARLEVLRHRFNNMISIVIASFVTTLIAGLNVIYGWGAQPEATVATAVLYLVPGVPLVNSVIDLIEGFLSSAWNRALFGTFILLCIAVGMALSISLLGISNF